MPSFETDVVLRALLEKQVYATIGPDYLGPDACAELAEELKVPKNVLWGALCNLRSEGRLDVVRVPDTPRRVALMPTFKGEKYFEANARKQPYPIHLLHRCHSTSV